MSAPPPLEPVAQRRRRLAVLAVVVGDLLHQLVVELLGAAEFERHFEVAARDRRVAELRLAGVAVQRFELLEAVAIDPGAHRLAHDCVQVDQPAAAQQLVEHVAVGVVAGHQALERGGLVGAEVVDVHAGVSFPHARDELQERHQRGPLVGGGQPPALLAAPAVAVAPRPAGQVLAAVRADERVALEVEEHVAVVGLRQPREAALRFERQPLERRDLLAARRDLQPRLMPEPLVGLLRAALRRLRQLAAAVGELRHRRHALPLELTPVRRVQPGDLGQVVVGDALVAAVLPEPTDVAVGARIGVGLWRRRLRAFELGPHQPEVGRELGAAIAFVAGRGHHVQLFGLGALQLAEQHRVGAQLQQRARLGVAGQLGVDRFVDRHAGRRTAIRAQQHVGDPAHAGGRQRRLHQHVVALAHRRQRGLDVARVGEQVHGAALVAQLLHVGGFVREAAFFHRFAPGVGRQVHVELSRQSPAMQLRQVGACEVRGDGCGGKRRSLVHGAECQERHR